MILLIGYLLLTLVVAAVLFYAVVALLPAGLSVPPQSDRMPFELPQDRRLRPGDLDRMRLPISLRGYRFSETDDLIDRLAAEIVIRDEELARLRQLPGAAAASGVSAEFPAEQVPVEQVPAALGRPVDAPLATNDDQLAGGDQLTGGGDRQDG